MKKLITLIAILFSTYTFAQKRQNVTYFKNGIPTTDQEKADFRRVVQEPDSGSTLYNLYEFYLDNTEKTIGFVSSFSPKLVYEGELKTFNKKGILIEKENYKKGKINGPAFYYFDNGQIKSEVFYEDKLQDGIIESYVCRQINLYDSIGVQMIKDGNGTYKSTRKNSSVEGNYVNGYKDGIWKGVVGDQRYEETYKDTKFVSGTAYLSDGKKIDYKVSEQPPSFPGGMEKFYRFLSKNIKYPAEAQKNKISGKTYVSFVVEKDGSLTEFKFKNNLGYGTQEEILRVLSNCPNWNPGTQHGLPVRVLYNIPISLMLN